MKLQLDTTLQIHRLVTPPNDAVHSEFNAIAKEAESVEASTYSKKEFAFSLIKDCCTMLARVTRTKSLSDAWQFIDRYGSLKKRFRGRMLSVCWKFQISETIKGEWVNYDPATRDRILAGQFAQFLRLYIPIFWESFENGLNLPLQDRTKCPFAYRGPVDNGKTFDLTTKRKCNPSSNCALPNLITGEHDRALKLLASLRALQDQDRTEELRKIEDVLESFFEKREKAMCYEMCNQGIGDLIIALETHPDRTLVTTNAKESNIISPAISQQYIVLPSKRTT